MRIIYKYAVPPSQKVKKDRIAEVDAYFNSKNGYIDLSSIGIYHVECDVVKDNRL